MADFDPTEFGAIPLDDDGSEIEKFDPRELGAIEIDETGAQIETETPDDSLPGEQVVPGAPPVAATVAEDAGFFERVGEQLSERGEQFGEIAGRFETQTFPETVLQGVGTTLGSAFDVAGEAAATAAGGVAYAFTAIAPETAATIADTWAQAVGSDVAQAGLAAIQAGTETYNAWAEENPRAAANLGALVNIATVAAPVTRGARVANVPGPAGRVAARLETAAATQGAEQAKKAFDDLILPKETAAVLKEQAGRTDASGVVTLTPREQAMSAAVATVPDLKPKGPLRQSLQAINAEVTREADVLRSTLATSGNSIPRNVINTEFRDLLKTARAAPSAGANIGNATKKMIDVAKAKIGKKGNVTTADLLEARRAFDRDVERAGVNLAPTPKSVARKDAAIEVRNAMNDLIARFEPSTEVRTSLRRQSDLLGAAENIGTKAGAEAKTTAQRLLQKIEGAVTLKRAASAGASAVGLGLAPAGTTTGIAAALASGTIVYAGTKAVMSRRTKTALSKLLRATDQAIKGAKKGSQAAQELRADRSALVGILNDSVVTKGSQAAQTEEEPAVEQSQAIQAPELLSASLSQRLRDEFSISP